MVLARILVTKPYADVTLEKTPGHGTCGRGGMLDFYPEARFARLTRDPPAAVAYLKAASKSWWSSWASSRLIDNRGVWSTSVPEGMKIGVMTTDYLEACCEDLKQREARILQSIFEWVGVASSPGECLPLPGGFYHDREATWLTWPRGINH